jgi:hypothetical protein
MSFVIVCAAWESHSLMTIFWSVWFGSVAYFGIAILFIVYSMNFLPCDKDLELDLFL